MENTDLKCVINVFAWFVNAGLLKLAQIFVLGEKVHTWEVKTQDQGSRPTWAARDPFPKHKRIKQNSKRQLLLH